jgi:hypothetical protein
VHYCAEKWENVKVLTRCPHGQGDDLNGIMGAGKADDHRGHPPVAACPGAHPGDVAEVVAQLLCHSRRQTRYAATFVLERDPAVVIGEVPVVVRHNVPDRPHRRNGEPGDQAEEGCSCCVNLQRDGDMVVSAPS